MGISRENQDLNTMRAGWEEKKDQWKKEFVDKINNCFINHDALTRAFNQRESLDKRFQENDFSPFVQLPSNTFTNAELELALHGINNSENKGTVKLEHSIATYLIHDAGRAQGYLKKAGLSKEEIESIRKIDQLKYDAIIFSCLSDFNVQMLEDLTKTSLFSNDEEGGLLEGVAIVNEFSQELATVAKDIIKNKIAEDKDKSVISEEKLSELKKAVSEEIEAKNRFDTAITELEAEIKKLNSPDDLGERVFYQRIAEKLKLDLENDNKNSHNYNKDTIDAFTVSVKKTIEALKEPKEQRASKNIDNKVVMAQLEQIKKFEEALKSLKEQINNEPDSLEKENFTHIVKNLESSFNNELLQPKDDKAFDSEMVDAYIKAVKKTESSLEKLKRESIKLVDIESNKQNVISQASTKLKTVPQKQKPKTFFHCLFSAALDAINPAGTSYKAALTTGLVCAGIAFVLAPPLTIFAFMVGFATVFTGVSLGNAVYDYRHQNNEKKPKKEIKNGKKTSSTGGLFKRFQMTLTLSLKAAPKQTADAVPTNAPAEAPKLFAAPQLEVDPERSKTYKIRS